MLKSQTQGIGYLRRFSGNGEQSRACVITAAYGGFASVVKYYEDQKHLLGSGGV